MGLAASKFFVFRFLVLGALAGMAIQAQAAYDMPAPTDPKAQAMLQRFLADMPKVETDASFFTPVSGAAWPCAVSERQQYQASGLMMAIPEEREKISKMSRKVLRDMGMDASKSGSSLPVYSNIVVTPLRANCKDGKLDGEVEVLASYESLVETVTTMPINNKAVQMTSRFASRETHRGISRFEAGEFKTMITSYKKTYNKHSTTYDDEAVAKMLAGSAPPEVKEPNLYVIYYPNEGKGMMGMFTILTTPKFSAGLLGVNTRFERGVSSSFTDGMGTNVTRMESWTGKEVSVVSTTPMRDNKNHGEQITLVDNYLKKNNLRMDQIPGMEQARIVNYNGQEMIETRMCFIEGEQVKTTTCPKD